MDKVEFINEEIERIKDKIKSIDEYIKIDETAKLNLELFIKMLDEIVLPIPISFTVSGLKYCYDDQLRFINKMIDDKKKQRDKYVSQLKALIDIKDMLIQ